MYDSAYTSKNCIFYSLEIKLVYSEYWFFLLLVNCFIFNYVCVDFTVTLMYVWRLTVKDFWYYFFFYSSYPAISEYFQECLTAGYITPSRFPTLWAVTYVGVSFGDGTVFELLL